jgi:predicted small lipoprotein YifL
MKRGAMQTFRRRIIAVSIVSAVTGCGTHQGPITKPPATKSVTVTATKFFSVTKKRILGNCKIDVAPAKGDNVRVNRGDEVAWVLGNDCDSAQDLTLTFFPKDQHKQGNGVDVITFSAMEDGVLKGKVNNIDLGGQPYRVFRYRIKVGNHTKDPEIIVF